MSFPRYPKYKDSGVEWLGEVPEHWCIAKFRHRFTESPEKIEEIIDAYSIGDEFHFHPVSTRVNSVRNNDP